MAARPPSGGSGGVLPSSRTTNSSGTGGSLSGVRSSTSPGASSSCSPTSRSRSSHGDDSPAPLMATHAPVGLPPAGDHPEETTPPNHHQHAHHPRTDALAPSKEAQASMQSAAMYLLDGTPIQRGLLCFCAQQQQQQQAQVQAVVDGPSIDLSRGQLSLLSPVEHASLSLSSHSARCVRILAKGSGSASGPAAAGANPDYQALLRYELFLHQRLATEMAKKEPASQAYPPMRPYLHQTAEATWLILPDGGGESLLTAVRTQQQPRGVAHSHHTSPLVSDPPAAYVQHIIVALRATHALLAALQHLHACGIVHKAINPASLLWNPQTNTVQLLDLSHASLLAQELSATEVNLSRPEQLLYIAPEQTGKATRTIDNRSDLYAVGCVAYELLTGKTPFVGRDALEIIHMHLAKACEPIARFFRPAAAVASGEPSASSAILPALLGAVQRVLKKALEKQPEDRFQAANGFRHDIQSILQLVTSTPAASASASPSESTSSFFLASTTTATTASALDSSTPSRIVPVPSSATIAAAAAAAAAPPVDPSSTSALVRSLVGFEAGRIDQVSAFRLSQRLYGRDAEIAVLRNAYRRIAEGTGTGVPMDGLSSSGRSSSSRGAPPASALQHQSVQPIFVALGGRSGAGKTSLINELQVNIVSARGLLARCKFDLYKRESVCLLQAFGDLVGQLLARDPLAWRVRILKAVGANARVITELIPELSRLLGPQPPVAKLSTADTANRMAMVLLQFVGALCTSKSPLTLFIDDLQWADAGSLGMLKHLMTIDAGHLLIIGAYRSNEVDSTHALMQLLASVRESAPNRIIEMQLQPLAPIFVKQLVMDSFRVNDEQGMVLANLLHSRTAGNPFAMSACLKHLYAKGLLHFDHALSSWLWDIEGIRKTTVSEDSAALLLESMQGLSKDEQLVLQYAACSGNRVDLYSLSLYLQKSGMSVQRVAAVCVALEQSGLLLCISHAKDLLLVSQAASPSTNSSATLACSTDALAPADATVASASTSSSSSSSGMASPSEMLSPTRLASRLSAIRCAFAHDKIQQAAYQLIPPGRISSMHCTIALQLMQHYASSELEEYAIEIASHIGTGLQTPGAEDEWRDFFQQPNMIARVLTLEMHAGRQAKTATAYPSALTFFNFALQLVEKRDGLVEGTAALAFEPSTPSRTSSFSSSTSASVGVSAIHPPAIETAQTVPCSGAQLTEPTPPPSTAVAAGGGGGGGPSDSLATSGLVDSDWLVHPSRVSPLHHDLSDFYRVSSRHWSTSKEQCLDLSLEVAQCWFLLSDWPKCQHVVEYALSHLSDLNDRARLFELDIQCQNQQANHTRSIEKGLSHLRELGVTLLAEMPRELHEWFARGMDGCDSDESFLKHPLFALPDMQEHLGITVMRTLNALIPPLYLTASPQLFHVIQSMLQTTRERGVTIESTASLACYSVLQWCAQEMQLCYAFSKCGQLLLERYADAGRSAAGRANTMILGLAYPWKVQLRSLVQLEAAAIVDALQVGDLDWSSWMLCHISWIGVCAGLTLPAAKKRLIGHHSECVKQKLPFSQMAVDIFLYFCEEAQCVPHTVPKVRAEELLLPLVQCTERLTAGMVLFYQQRPRESLLALESAFALLSSSPCFPFHATAHYYLALTLAALCPRIPYTQVEITADTFDLLAAPQDRPVPAGFDSARAKATLQRIDQLIHQMQIWARGAPTNYLHLLVLMKAERHRAAMFSSDPSAKNALFPALQLYDAAVELSSRDRFSTDTAIALELAARFHFDCHRPAGAIVLLKQAVAAYTTAGVELKVRSLTDEFPQYLARSSTPSGGGGRLQTTINIDGSGEASVMVNSTPIADLPIALPAGTNAEAATPSLDALSALKATASFATETSEPRLLRRLMSIVLETAGATSGCLVLEDPTTGNWCVELAGSVDADEGAGLASAPMSIQEANANGGEEAAADRGAKPMEDVTDEGAHQTTTSHRYPRHDTRFSVYPAGLDLSTGVVGASGPSSGEDLPLLAAPPSECPSASSSTNSFVAANGAHLHLLLGSASAARSVETALPTTLFQFVLSTSETLLLTDVSMMSDPTYAAFSSDVFFQKKRPKAMLCMPVLKAGAVFGVLYLQNEYRSSAFTSSHIQLLQLLCSQAALSLTNARYQQQLQANNASLEEQVKSRTKQLELAKETAEKATKIKADFLSNMSHEIRTPMNAVIGLSRLLQSTGLTSEQEQYVGMIDASGGLLLTIINDILDYSKIEAGQLSLTLSPANLLDCLETAVLLIYRMSTAKGLSLSYFIDPTIPDRLMIDSQRLQQVLLNLLSNAVKFCQVGSVKLEVSAELLPPPHHRSASQGSEETDPQQYQITMKVIDTGIGIEPKHMQLLFRSFSQVQHAGEYGGTGLGLVISRRLVQAMGGDIVVESAVGQGSTFTATIVCDVAPILQPASSSMVVSPLTSGPPARIPVLHGLNEDERREFSRLTLLYIGASHAAADAWQRLVRAYGAEFVHSSCARLAAEVVGEGRVPIVVLSLETMAMDEEQCAQLIARTAHRRVIIIYSRIGPTETVYQPSVGGAARGETTLANSHLNAEAWSQQAVAQPFQTVRIRTPFKQVTLLSSLLNLARSLLTPTASPASIAQRRLEMMVATPSQALRRISDKFPLRILLAEDNKINQKMMSMMMCKLGYEMIIASNGKEVLEVLARESAKGPQHEIECILMDASMDVMDGLECTRLIRSQHRAGDRRVFICALTANVTNDFRQRCADAGMDRFETKPVELLALTAALQAAHKAAQEQTFL